ncbi:MAG: hypothetical protein ACKVPX_18290 [Myxococcaceae bacterium]
MSSIAVILATAASLVGGYLWFQLPPPRRARVAQRIALVLGILTIAAVVVVPFVVPSLRSKLEGFWFACAVLVLFVIDTPGKFVTAAALGFIAPLAIALLPLGRHTKTLRRVVYVSALVWNLVLFGSFAILGSAVIGLGRLP